MLFLVEPKAFSFQSMTKFTTNKKKKEKKKKLKKKKTWTSTTATSFSQQTIQRPFDKEIWALVVII